MGIQYGLRGSLFRGATSVGFAVPTALSLQAVKDGMAGNPTAIGFELRVNPYVADKAESIAAAFEPPLNVILVAKFGAEEWLLCPLHEFGRF